ncbi:MAG: MFS transporter [Actinocatenispora sp.]
MTEAVRENAGRFQDRTTRVAVAASFFVQGLCFAALVTQVPVLREKHGLTDLQLSVVLLAVPVVAGVGSLLAGQLAKRWGSATVVRGSVPMVCLSLLAAGVSPGRTGFFVAVAFFGLAVGVSDATMNMQGVSLERQYGRSIMGSFHAVWSGAGIVGAAISSANEGFELPLWAGFGVAAVGGAILSVVAGPRLVTRATEQALMPEAGLARTAPAVPWRPILLIGVAVSFMYIADSATSNWSAEYLRHGLSSKAALAAWGYAAYQGCMLVGRAGADQLVRRFGSVRAVRTCSAVGVVGLALVVVAPDPVLAIIGFGVLGLGLCAIAPQSFSAASRYDPTGSGIAVSRVNLFNYVGFVVGAPLVGAVQAMSDWRVGFAVPLVVVAGLIPLAAAFRPARGHTTMPAGPPVPQAVP